MDTAMDSKKPSEKKAWLKYYSEQDIAEEVPSCSLYDYIYQNNKEHLEDIALSYFGN